MVSFKMFDLHYSDGINAWTSTDALYNLMESQTLEREWMDTLFPNLLFRSEAEQEEWRAGIGETLVKSKAGHLSPAITPLNPTRSRQMTGQTISEDDAEAVVVPIEQWTVTVNQFGGPINTHLPSNYVQALDQIIADTQALAGQAARTLNTLARNEMFKCYGGGDSWTIAEYDVAGTDTDEIVIACGNNFLENLYLGRYADVSATNPIYIQIHWSSDGSAVDSIANDVQVTGVSVGAAAVGKVATLTLGAVFGSKGVGATIPLHSRIVVSTAPSIIIAGAADTHATVHDLDENSPLTWTEISQAVAKLRNAGVPKFSDGYYHCHLNSFAVQQFLADMKDSGIYNSLPHGTQLANQAIGYISDCLFIPNEETPNTQNCPTVFVDQVDTVDFGGAGSIQVDSDTGLTLVNEGGRRVGYAIVLGRGVLKEHYIDESSYLKNLGANIVRYGNWFAGSMGAGGMMERIRLTILAPVDRTLSVMAQTWTYSGGFACPVDGIGVGGLSNAKYRRAVLIAYDEGAYVG